MRPAVGVEMVTASVAAGASACGSSTENMEPRPGTELHVDGMVEDLADTLDNGEAEAETADGMCRPLQPLELLEDQGLPLGIPGPVSRTSP